MAYTDALSAYKETRIRTAGQGQLILMMYDAAIKQMDKALELIQAASGGKKAPGSLEKINASLVKTQEIITELMASLDFEAGGDIAQNLFSLYNWFNRELLQANISSDAHRISRVREQMDALRSAWQEIAIKTPTEAGKTGSGINIAG